MTLLRPYQARALSAIRAILSQGAIDGAKCAPKVLCIAPTGAGKTVVGVAATDGYASVLWVTHRAELIEQTYAAVRNAGDRSVSIVRADDGRLADGADITIASVQTLLRRPTLRPSVGLVVLDEAHHYAASEWHTLAQHYAGVPTLGLTATPMRADGSPLGDIFDRIVIVAQYQELIESGHLVDCEVIAPRERLDVGTVSIPDSAIDQSVPTVAFCQGLRDATELCQRVPNSRMVSGSMRQSERVSALADFASGACNFLANVGVLTEGWDCPRAQRVILARRCGSVGLYLQIVGRALRPFAGKHLASVYDLSGAIWEYGHPTAAREYELDGAAIRHSKASVSVWQCSTCGLCALSKPNKCPRCGAVGEGRTSRVRTAPIERWVWTCQGCGHERGSVPLSCPMCGRVSERGASVGKESQSKREAYYDGLLATAKQKCYKRGWVEYKFKAKYGYWHAKCK